MVKADTQLQTIAQSATAGALAMRPSDGDLLAAFGEFMRLDVAEGDASPETIRTYYTNVKAFVAWCSRRGVPPAQISDGDLKEYRAELAPHYTRDSVATKLASVRRLYAMLHARGYRADNPALGLRAKRDATERAERIGNKFLTLPEAARVLALPDVTTPQGKRDRAILSFFIHNGARVSEVAGLNVDDLDLARGEVTIRRGKGAKTRALLIEPNVIADLREWLAVRSASAHSDDAGLFVALNHDPRERGKRITARAIRLLVDRYFRAAGCKRKGVSCHSLRHTFATLAIANGAKVLAVSKQLGHADLKTTQVYADIINKRADNPARFIAELLGTAVK